MLPLLLLFVICCNAVIISKLPVTTYVFKNNTVKFKCVSDDVTSYITWKRLLYGNGRLINETIRGIDYLKNDSRLFVIDEGYEDVISSTIIIKNITYNDGLFYTCMEDIGNGVISDENSGELVILTSGMSCSKNKSIMFWKVNVVYCRLLTQPMIKISTLNGK